MTFLDFYGVRNKFEPTLLKIRRGVCDAIPQLGDDAGVGTIIYAELLSELDYVKLDQMTGSTASELDFSLQRVAHATAMTMRKYAECGSPQLAILDHYLVNQLRHDYLIWLERMCAQCREMIQLANLSGELSDSVIDRLLFLRAQRVARAVRREESYSIRQEDVEAVAKVICRHFPQFKFCSVEIAFNAMTRTVKAIEFIAKETYPSSDPKTIYMRTSTIAEGAFVQTRHLILADIENRIAGSN